MSPPALPRSGAMARAEEALDPRALPLPPLLRCDFLLRSAAI
jgi:hypothetical protein